MSLAAPNVTHGPPRRRLGILGGLGPHAHIAFERHLLERCLAGRDQEYPEWVVLSFTHIPDRTAALLGHGPSPQPALVQGLQLLASLVDVTVVPCNTAHAFLDKMASPVPLLRLPETAALPFSPGQRVGLLATTGTLLSRVYPRARPDLGWVSLWDLPGGEELQETLVMDSIYGPAGEGGRRSGGIKAGVKDDPTTGRPYAAALQEAAEHLFSAGATHVIAACTEIPLALPRSTRIIDPLWEVAGLALQTLGYPIR